MPQDCPLARSEGLIIEELDGELLVYDSESNLAHALEPQAAAVWRASDGHADVVTLAARCHTSEEDVRITLARLGGLGLLEGAQSDEDGDTRRSALRKIGIAGVGVATISSILVPAAAAAGSCAQPGDCVSQGQTCCAGHPVGSSFCPTGQPGVYGPVCCVPPGGCAVEERDIPTPTFLCCNGTGVPDSSCNFSINPRFTGFRCT
jgi:hypothetical protein